MLSILSSAYLDEFSGNEYYNIECHKNSKCRCWGSHKLRKSVCLEILMAVPEHYNNFPLPVSSVCLPPGVGQKFYDIYFCNNRDLLLSWLYECGRYRCCLEILGLSLTLPDPHEGHHGNCLVRVLQVPFWLYVSGLPHPIHVFCLHLWYDLIRELPFLFNFLSVSYKNTFLLFFV